MLCSAAAVMRQVALALLLQQRDMVGARSHKIPTAQEQNLTQH
jgi:hypothetical protein